MLDTIRLKSLIYPAAIRNVIYAKLIISDISCGCEIWSVLLRLEERGLKHFSCIYLS
jgi:hypothetical protein